jgi:hypothetical protein
MNSKLTEMQIIGLEVMGFTKEVVYGEVVLRKTVKYSILPQDDIEDIMNADDIILSNEPVDVFVNEDGSVSLESGTVAVGPINAGSPLANKIIEACT